MARSMVRAHPNSVGPSGNLNVRSGSVAELAARPAVCPLFLAKQKFVRGADTSVECHEQTFATTHAKLQPQVIRVKKSQRVRAEIVMIYDTSPSAALGARPSAFFR
jgi:hypothetical protein